MHSIHIVKGLTVFREVDYNPIKVHSLVRVAGANTGLQKEGGLGNC